jgi:glycosyltransferase involved in cell wall biosynthesis
VKIALVSPLPPARTGVADYASALQKELSKHAQVTAIESPNLAELETFDACLYQLGNNQLHGDAYEAALGVPGVVVLHDVVLHHFMLGRLSRQEYIEEFVYNHGEWMRHLGEELWRDRVLSAADHRYFEYPMIRRLVECSRAVIVHNPKAKRMVSEAASNAGLNPSSEPTSEPTSTSASEAALAPPIFEIPHFTAAPELPGESERAATRKRLNIPADAVVIATFGYMRPSKRLRSLVHAARALTTLTTPYRLLLVGDFVSPEYETTVDAVLDGIPSIRLPFVPEEEFWQLVAVTDICVNLRYPSAGETSGIAAKLTAAGKPVIVTNGEEYAGYPEGVVLKVDAGESEVELLAHYLCALAEEPEMRSVIGGRAARFAAEHQSIERAGALYMQALRQVAGLR